MQHLLILRINSFLKIRYRTSMYDNLSKVLKRSNEMALEQSLIYIKFLQVSKRCCMKKQVDRIF